MATLTGGAPQITGDHLIVIKVAIDGTNRKFKLPLKELNATTLPLKLREVLQIPAGQEAVFERFSDSSSAFLDLDPANPSSYKQLYRAAKAKLKLRLRVTFPNSDSTTPKSAVKEQVIDSTSATPATDSQETPTPTPMALPEVLQLRPKDNVTPVGNTQPPSDGIAKLTRLISEMDDTLAPPTFWQVFCNNCDKSLSDAHFHCGICDKGDYDLCEACVNSGKLCNGEGHWLIKRFVKNGKMVNSTTEKVAPRPRDVTAQDIEVPGAYKSETLNEKTDTRKTRTCNNCIRVLPENVLMGCQDCDDFDLCFPCVSSGRHGHHPAHSFKALGPCAGLGRHSVGNNVKHAAICDKCDKSIIGVRHKCLDCPDWDYCNDCYATTKKEHPGHRFVPVYFALEAPSADVSDYTLHNGIYCDGPLCSGKPHQSYIRGDRFKCAICHDTDFCANCEAHPKSKHNATHPMIKFKTHIRGVAVTTTGDDGQGQELPTMGDQAAVTPAPAIGRNLGTLKKATPSTETLPAYTPMAKSAAVEATSAPLSNANTIGLDAHFVRDAIRDGTQMSPGLVFPQVWTLRNPGPEAWPVGCSVRHVGGDDMLTIDRSHVIAVERLHSAGRTTDNTVTVAAGGEADFAVTLRAPPRAGKHISYWRLHDPEGVPFGHKLWCDVEVKPLPTLPPFPLREPSQEATTAAGKAWHSPPSVLPTTTQIIPNQYNSGPVMPTINQAARFGMPPQVRLRAMELQNRHRLLREQWNNGATQPFNEQERQKLVAERQQLQTSMQQFASTYRPAPQSLVPKENQEMRELMAKQQNRREELLSMAEGAGKEQAKISGVHLDNQEMNQLIMSQKRRRAQVGQMRNQNQATMQGPDMLANSSNAAQQSGRQPYDPAYVQARREYLLAQKAETLRRRTEPRREAGPEVNVRPRVQLPPVTSAASVPVQVKGKGPTVEDIDPATEAALADAPLQKSEMVFPKLEKESPTSSIELKSEGAVTAPSTAVSEAVTSDAAPSTVASKASSVVSETTAAGDDVGDDFESVGADDVEVYNDAESGIQSDDDGFDTDEYDILDASDEEAMDAAKHA